MAVERFLEFFAAAIDERPDAGRVWSGGGAVPGVVRGSSRSASSSRNRASRSLPGGIERTQAQVLADAVLMVGDRLLPTGVGVDRQKASAPNCRAANRFIRTLKENLLWVRSFDTIEELRLALLAFKRTYNEQWMLEKYHYRSPAQVRRDLVGLDAAA